MAKSQQCAYKQQKTAACIKKRVKMGTSGLGPRPEVTSHAWLSQKPLCSSQVPHFFLYIPHVVIACYDQCISNRLFGIFRYICVLTFVQIKCIYSWSFLWLGCFFVVAYIGCGTRHIYCPIFIRSPTFGLLPTCAVNKTQNPYCINSV